MDSVSGGFSEGLVGFTKSLYDDRYVGTYTKIESNFCFLSVSVIMLKSKCVGPKYIFCCLPVCVRYCYFFNDIFFFF